MVNFRRRVGWNQEKLAHQLGISRNYVGMLESGRVPSPTLAKLFDTLLSSPLYAGVAPVSETIIQPDVDYGSNPRETLKRRREGLGLTPEQFAEKTGFKASYILDIEDGHSRANERFLRKAAEVLDLPLEALMGGSDQPLVIDETGRHATFGSQVTIKMPPGKTARYVPLLSYVQAGTLNAGHLDEAYDYTGVIAVDISDPKPFGLTAQGDSMIPRIHHGDDLIVCPNWTLYNGDVVAATTVKGDVMVKIYHSQDDGERIILSSYNPAFPPQEYKRQDIKWVYPVGQVIVNIGGNRNRL